MGQVCGSNQICGKEMGENMDPKQNMNSNEIGSLKMKNMHSQTGAYSHNGLFDYDRNQEIIKKKLSSSHTPTSPSLHSMSHSHLIMSPNEFTIDESEHKSPATPSLSPKNTTKNNKIIRKLPSKAKLLKSRPSTKAYFEIDDEEKDTYEDPPIFPKREQMNSAEFTRAMNDTLLDRSISEESMIKPSQSNTLSPISPISLQTPSFIHKTNTKTHSNSSKSENKCDPNNTPKQLQISSNQTSCGNESVINTTPASVYPHDFADSVRSNTINYNSNKISNLQETLSNSSMTETFERIRINNGMNNSSNGVILSKESGGPINTFENLKFVGSSGANAMGMDDRANIQIQNIYNEYNYGHNLSMSEVNPLSHFAPYAPRMSSSSVLPRDSFVSSMTDVSGTGQSKLIDWRFSSMSGGSGSVSNNNNNNNLPNSEESVKG